MRYLAYTLIIVLPIILPYAEFLPYWLPVFGIGILIFLYKSNLISVTEFMLVSLVFAIDIFVFNQLIACAVALIAEFVIVFMFSKTNKILAWLGKFSYSVYLIHAIIGAAAVNILSHYATNSFTKIAIVIAGVIVTFVSSYLMYLFVENPSKKLSSKLAYRTQHAD
jgi:peptidoglycan/LPS O-acetylase OafA/YrhL